MQIIFCKYGHTTVKIDYYFVKRPLQALIAENCELSDQLKEVDDGCKVGR